MSVQYLSFQSEHSAFERVASTGRQPLRGCVQPADPGHTAQLVTLETPESSSECSWVGATAQNTTRPPALKVLEGERKGARHICESKAEEDMLKKSLKMPLTLEDNRPGGSREVLSGKEDSDEPVLGMMAMEHPRKDLQSLASPTAECQPPERPARSEVVLYMQSKPASQEAQLTGHANEAPARKHRVRTRSLSDFTGPAQLLKGKDPAARRGPEPVSSKTEVPWAEASLLDTKVSVAQLRSMFLESASAGQKPEL